MKTEETKYMNICVCIDDNLGMSFFGKRQSRDKKLIERLLSHKKYKKVYISAYSLPLFAESEDARVCVTRDFSEAGEEDICFFELEHITEYDKDIKGLVIYRWNRAYPSDKKFPYSPEDKGFTLVSTDEFCGSSHDRITEEIWTR